MKIVKFSVILGVIVLGVVVLLVVGSDNKPANSSNSSKVTLAQVQSSLGSGAALIDVRTAEEYAAGHAKGAINFDVAKMQAGQLPEVSKNKPVYLYCRSGRRASQAKTILEASGFKDVKNLGGLSDWQALGAEVVKP